MSFLGELHWVQSRPPLGYPNGSVMTSETCPFKAGDTVVYRPSERGRGLVANTDFATLVPGNRYKIVRIVRGAYLVIEGFENSPGSGLYWTEFSDK